VSLSEAIGVAVSGGEVPGPLLSEAFREICAGNADQVQIAALLVALRTRGESVGEMVAVARALRESAETAPCLDPRTVDTCGTGGDGAGTFNISTTVAFVVAGAGVPVAKHGNRAASSRTGSIDVLEALGVCVDLPVAESARILERVGIAAFFARRAHPAMRHVAPVRQALGIRTIMNAMGPLLNPLGVKVQIVGVYSSELVVPLAEALAALGTERALVVHGADGLDEISVTAHTHAARLHEGRVERLQIDPPAHGVALAPAETLRGGDADHNARLLRDILEGQAGPRRDVVLLNAAAVLWVAGEARDLDEGLEIARSSIDSGAACARLDALVAVGVEAA
jgi:anthranilate phosphoribosyltransferase